MEETRDWVLDFLEEDRAEESEGSSDESESDSSVGGVAGMVSENHQREDGQISKSETDAEFIHINMQHLSGEGLKEDFVSNNLGSNGGFNVGPSEKIKKKKYKRKIGLGRVHNSGSLSPNRDYCRKRARVCIDGGPDPFVHITEVSNNEKSSDNIMENRVSGDQENPVEGRSGAGEGEIDLNARPSIMGEERQVVEEDKRDGLAGNEFSTRVRLGRGREIDATMEMGAKIGVQLASFESLILDSIELEEVQQGLS